MKMRQIPYLKSLTRYEGKVGDLSLFFSPLVSDAAVPDDHLMAILIKTRVKVKGKVMTSVQVHCDPEKQK